MATAVTIPNLGQRERLAVAYAWTVSVWGLVLAVYATGRIGGLDVVELAPWVLAALIGDALAVRLSGTVALSASLPVTLAASFVLDPALVGLVGFLSVWQMPGRSWRYLGFSVFNRFEVAIAAAVGASVVQALGAESVGWPWVIAVAVAGLLADSIVNLVLMLPIVYLREDVRLAQAVRGFLGLRPLATLAAYGSAALAAPVLVLAWTGAGVWGLMAALVCVALAGLGLRSSQKRGEAETELISAKALVKEGTNQIAMERRDERRSLAGELHDDVLPAMFKVHLMGEVIRRDLESGRLLELEEDVRGLIAATDYAQTAVRGVVGDLRESPIGVKGLAGSVRLLCDRLALDGPAVHVDVGSISCDERAQTVAYQVVREALTNAAKYSRASEIRVTIREESPSLLRVAVSDDGCGFDVQEGLARSDHFGLTLMRERVAAVGGDLQVESRLGRGTLVWAILPS